MKDVYDYAKYLLKKGADGTPNTYDGNMKLQKLLVLADMVHIAEFGAPLFEDEVLAFKDGYVVEKVRQRYQYDYKGFKNDSDRFEPDFSAHEYTTIENTLGIFGNVSARQLSDLTHTFDSWKRAYDRGTLAGGYHSKKKSVVDFREYPQDIEKIKKALGAYNTSRKYNSKSEVINGVTFYYSDVDMTGDVFNEIKEFSLVCEDDAYTVCLDNGRLVIY